VRESYVYDESGKHVNYLVLSALLSISDTVQKLDENINVVIRDTKEEKYCLMLA
jgi:hypothetical protein